MTYSTVTVTGSFPGQTGTVTFTPPGSGVTDVTGTIPQLGPQAFTYQLSGGTFTTGPLLATDSEGLLPAGWCWQVKVALDGQRPYTYPVLLPSALGAALSLSDLPVSPAGQVPPGLTPSGTALPGEVPIATGDGGAAAWGTAPGLQPSGDLSGITDLANMTGILAIAGELQLGYGQFYVAGPVVPLSGSVIRGQRGCSPSGDDAGIPPAVPVGTVINPVTTFTTPYSTAGVITLPDGSTGIHLADFWVRGLSAPAGPSGPAALDGICTTGTGTTACFFSNVGAVWNTGNGIALYAGNGNHTAFCYAGNNLGHGVVSATADTSHTGTHAQSNGQSGTTGDGFYNIGANTNLTACRADLNQNGFTVNGSDGGGYLGGVRIIGGGTQRNNFYGVNVVNSSTNGLGLRDLVTLAGVVLNGDGQNGTNSYAGGITGGTGLGYAGVSVSGRNVVTMTGCDVLVGTVDVAGGCPQYGIATAVQGTSSAAPTLIQVDGGVINAITAAVNDVASVGASIKLGPTVIENVGQQFYGGANTSPVSYAALSGAAFTGAVTSTVSFTSSAGFISAGRITSSGLFTATNSASRYVGAIASGSAPASGGPYNVGDWIVNQAGGISVCTVAGSVGTWVALAASNTTSFAPPNFGVSSASTAVIANQLYLATVHIPAPGTITGIALLNGGTAAGSVTVALFSSSGGTQLGVSASTVQAGTSITQRVPFTSPATTATGNAILAAVFSSASATVGTWTGPGQSATTAQGSYTMPGSVTAPTFQATPIPAMITY